MARVLDKEAILARLSALPGAVGFYYKDLLTGEELGFNENEEYEAASVIKLPTFIPVMTSTMAAPISMPVLE